MLYAASAGLILNSTGVELPIGLFRAIDLLADATIPGMLILLGIQLRSTSFAQDRLLIAKGAVVRILLAPILACAVALALLVIVPAAHDAGGLSPDRTTEPTHEVPGPGREEEPEPWQPRTASLVMGGDLLWHSPTWSSAQADHARTGRGRGYDFHPMFAAIH